MSPVKKLYLIFISAVIIKISLALFLNRPEVFEYEDIADNILAGNGFLYVFLGAPYYAFIQPFYPIFTSIIYYITSHSHLAILVIQSVVSSLLCFIVYFITRRFGGARGALAAAFITAFHPGLSVYSIFKLHPLAFDAFFYLLSLFMILRFMERPGLKNAVLSGFAFGMAILSRSTILPFFAFMLIFLLFVLKGMASKARIKYVAVICAAAFLIYLPWIVRNYRVFHRVVLFQTDAGVNLWGGNNDIASGSSILPSGVSVTYEKMPEAMREELVKLGETERQAYFFNNFLGFVKEKPVLFTELFIKKFYYFWWFSPQTGVFYAKLWLYIYKVYYGAILIFFMLGSVFLLRDKKNRVGLVTLFAYMLSISLVHALVSTDVRHRWTVEPVMIIISSIGFFSVLPVKENS